MTFKKKLAKHFRFYIMAILRRCQTQRFVTVNFIFAGMVIRFLWLILVDAKRFLLMSLPLFSHYDIYTSATFGL